MKDPQKIGVVYGALAFDLRIADPARKRILDVSEAALLAEVLRRNLIAECADIRALRLTLAPAFYDPCALLRIGWPLHRRLRALTRHSVGTHSVGSQDVIATVGEGGLPEPQGLAGGRELLSLPFVLKGPADCTKEAARQLDRNHMRLYTPRMRNDAFDLPSVPAFDAVGYLSLRSLSTEIGGRYYSEGLGDVWNLIERALRAPKREHTLEIDAPAARLRRLHYAEGRVRIASSTPGSDASCRRLLTAHGLKISHSSTSVR
jgi:hypothetical protein